jgi:hypothetical protein
VLAREGKVGFGFSLRLDATEARHMAEWNAGAREQRPTIEPLLAHPWETAFVAGEEIPWHVESGFGKMRWLSSERDL